MADKSFTLAEYGDAFETANWHAFLKDEFPTYGAVWAEYIAPLTGRPEHVHFKSDAELARIGRDAADICHAQLHYTTFTHLARAHALRRSDLETSDLFVEAMVRLSAATDVADELLERITKPGMYPPWKEGSRAREAWRKANDWPCQEVRRYRNRLLHGRLMPYIFVPISDPRVPGLVRQGIRVVKIGREARYIDWRVFVGGDAESRSKGAIDDFALAEEVVEDAWTRVLTYLEKEWKRTLLPAVATARS